jgi:cysteine-rich repeat protein
MLSAGGSPACAYCNISTHFQASPAADGSCQCAQHYELNGDACTEICGDGVVMNPAAGVCDDGNNIDGDGCSSTCLTEPFYRCSGGSSTTSTDCIYAGTPLTVTLKNVMKTEDFNEGVFTFDVKPSLMTFSQMSLTHSVSLLCNSEYTVTEISYAAGVLKVVVDYTKDMEGVECTLNIDYDSAVIKSANSSVDFQAVSSN